MTKPSAGQRFRNAVAHEKPLQVVGAINANHALLAQRAGYKAIYLSGGGVAAGSLGLPDLGISNLDDVLTDVRRITDVCDLPLLVDADNRKQGDADNSKFCGAGALSMNDRDNYAVLMRIAMLSSLKASDVTSNLGFRCAQ